MTDKQFNTIIAYLSLIAKGIGFILVRIDIRGDGLARYQKEIDDLGKNL